MFLEVLISTVDDRYFVFGKKLSVPNIIVNQLINKDESDYEQANLFSVKEKGLSKSRNKALLLSKADICLISDDDLSYPENFEKKIKNAFRNNPQADIITFRVVTSDGGFFKKYRKKSFTHNYRTLMKVSSIEIAFNRDKIKKNEIFFDERFGLGAEFATGEEVIFLTDAFKKGLKIIYVPETIAVHPLEVTSGANFEGNKNLIIAKGAMFSRIFGNLGLLLSFFFALKKYKMAEFGFLYFFGLMLKGFFKLKKETTDWQRYE